MCKPTAFLLFLLFLDASSAIKCVATRPDTYSKYEDCNHGFCVTVEYKNGTLWRGCPEESAYSCQVDIKQTIVGDAVYFCCTSNLCNASAVTTVSSILLVMTAVLVHLP